METQTGEREGQLTNGVAWAFVILGAVLFTSDIGLMKSVKSTAG